VFLDRDGVLNEPQMQGEAAGSPLSVDALRIVEGAVAFTAALRDAGYALIGVTNQPDVAKGSLTIATVEAMNERLAATLGIDRFMVCPHQTSDGCACRKPEPGMIHEAAIAERIDLSRSWLVGDRWVDIAAGAAAGVRTVLLERPYSWRPTSSGSPPEALVPDATVADLEECARVITGASRP
jgi:D-glycero-D-manno-heptose 1,7-bisphosphate phosphatase